ncbi:MAG: hypothetical protein LUG62_06010 [Clostridiales bacterium]|nr:hypothetical protein [Clostridiales bacterium]
MKIGSAYRKLRLIRQQDRGAVEPADIVTVEEIALVTAKESGIVEELLQVIQSFIEFSGTLPHVGDDFAALTLQIENLVQGELDAAALDTYPEKIRRAPGPLLQISLNNLLQAGHGDWFDEKIKGVVAVAGRHVLCGCGEKDNVCIRCDVSELPGNFQSADSRQMNFQKQKLKAGSVLCGGHQLFPVGEEEKMAVCCVEQKLGQRIGQSLAVDFVGVTYGNGKHGVSPLLIMGMCFRFVKQPCWGRENSSILVQLKSLAIFSLSDAEQGSAGKLLPLTDWQAVNAVPVGVSAGQIADAPAACGPIV